MSQLVIGAGDCGAFAHFFGTFDYFRAARALTAQPEGVVRTSTSTNPAAVSRAGSDDGSTEFYVSPSW